MNFKTYKENKKEFNNNKFNQKNDYYLKILLQTDNKNLKSLRNNFKSIKSKKSLVISTSLSGEILQGRFKRALKTIWNSKILYIYEPFLIVKLFIKLIKNK